MVVKKRLLHINYRTNKVVIKEKANNKYKNLTKEEKKKTKKEYNKNRYKKMKENPKQNTNFIL